LASGLRREETAALVRDAVAWRGAQGTALELLDQGDGVLDVRRKLVETGLDPEAAAAVVEAVQQQRSGEVRGESGYTERGVGQRLGLAILGLALLGAGVVLLIGNRTGAFPTVPFAGFLTMTIGSMVFGAACRGR
jgi:hypothetical protein